MWGGKASPAATGIVGTSCRRQMSRNCAMIYPDCRSIEPWGAAQRETLRDCG
jgi:hypothetical protein